MRRIAAVASIFRPRTALNYSRVGSKPSNGSRSAIGKDFGGVTNFIQQREKLDRNSRKTNCIGVVRLNICASSCDTDSFNKLADPKKFDESTGTSHNKRPRSVFWYLTVLDMKIYQSKLSAIMRNLLQTMSVGDIAKSWDFCAREVVTEYVYQLNGGGNFGSTNGTWEDHLSTAWLLICQSKRK
ncbi:hypothetical protein Vadar_034021 [Vaccinium darrowii]|uniref:Uncharacterized protein n=1 Tax=Vaccinium darrowii TaxID=229202 RepID=A0ACB7ZG00_9ERIC|nr:hypothetical protein Vadar_034021 [Vaccinium darrowii]